MSRSGLPQRLMVLVIGVVVVLAPVVIVLLTLAILMLTGDLVLGRVTPLTFVELYLIDLLLFSLFAYGLYRLMLTLVERQLPGSLDDLEIHDAERNENDVADEPD